MPTGSSMVYAFVDTTQDGDYELVLTNPHTGHEVVFKGKWREFGSNEYLGKLVENPTEK